MRGDSGTERKARAGRAAQLIAVAVLAALGAAYYVTWERAPGVSVRWREGVSAERRAALERRFRLARARDAEGRTITYDLQDIRSSNIRALLEQPEVEDTGYLDRLSHSVPANAPFGRGGTWIGTRLPLLRVPGVVQGIVAICVLSLGAPLVGHVVAARRTRARP